MGMRLLGAASLAASIVVALPAMAAAAQKSKHKASRQGQLGTASLYGDFQGKRTASGARYDGEKLTAAHRSLPLNSKVRVTNLNNGRSVLVTVNDRGPHRKDRVIDLSHSAAARLGMQRAGLARVLVEPIQVSNLPQ
jgi:rare lipoprotein A